jgi:hypothetical protein
VARNADQALRFRELEAHLFEQLHPKDREAALLYVWTLMQDARR